MAMHITHTKAFSRFLQIFDASFPSGAFVHSFGLEPHVVLEIVHDIKTLKQFLDNILYDQYQKLEFVYVKKFYALLEQQKFSVLIREDEKLSAMLSYEYAKASHTLGSNYLTHINFDIQEPIVQQYFEAVLSGKSVGNELSILTAYAYELKLDVNLMLLIWTKKSLMNIATASLKISRIKPSDIQKMLFEFDEVIEEYITNSSSNLSNFNPLFEENIFKHINLEPKLFMT